MTKLVQKGELLLITKEIYEDYEVLGLFEAVREFNVDSLKHLAQQGERRFVDLLLKEGWVKERKYKEWNLGSYIRKDFFLWRGGKR